MEIIIVFSITDPLPPFIYLLVFNQCPLNRHLQVLLVWPCLIPAYHSIHISLQVLLVRYKKTKKLYAMKVIKKSMINDEDDIEWVCDMRYCGFGGEG